MKLLKVIISIILLYGVVYGLSSYYKSTAETIEITVKDKERIMTGSGENVTSKFIVYTQNEVFENTDTFLYSKYTSSDFQNKLDKGQTYTVKVVGWRVPFLSMYRNIVLIEKSK